jgi:hypothetical protein
MMVKKKKKRCPNLESFLKYENLFDGLDIFSDTSFKRSSTNLKEEIKY